MNKSKIQWKEQSNIASGKNSHGKKHHFNDLLCRNLDQAGIIHRSDQSQSAEFEKMMCQLLQQQRVPDTGIDSFSGDPLDYHCFMEVFKEVV